MLKILLALACLLPSSLGDYNPAPNATPTLDLSAVRFIACDGWTGSGFLIGDKIMMTANHVLDGGKHCVDVESGSPLIIYKQDKAHDVVLATGPDLPTNLPYIKIACQPFKPGKTYMAYGITDYMQRRPILRENTIVATKEMATVPMNVDGKYELWGPMREFQGPVAPGMSGGPVVDEWGYAHGVVNGGTTRETDEFQLSDSKMCQSQ